MSSVLQNLESGMDLLEQDAGRIVKRMKTDWDAVVVNVGTPGCGKTVFSIQFAKMLCGHLGIDFDLETMITYDGAGFLELLDINDDMTPIILDEAGSALFSQEWSNAVNKAIVQALMVVRKRRKCMILNIPKLRFLNPGVSDRISLFNTIYTHRGKRGYAAVHYPTTSALSNYKYPYFIKKYVHRFPDLDPETKATYEPIEKEGKEMLLQRYIEKGGGNKLETLLEFLKGLDTEAKRRMMVNGRGEYQGLQVFSGDLMAEAVENASVSMCRAATKRMNIAILDKAGKA